MRAQFDRAARDRGGVISVEVFLHRLAIDAKTQHAVVPALRGVERKLAWRWLVCRHFQFDEIARLPASHKQLSAAAPPTRRQPACLRFDGEARRLSDNRHL